MSSPSGLSNNTDPNPVSRAASWYCRPWVTSMVMVRAVTGVHASSSAGVADPAPSATSVMVAGQNDCAGAGAVPPATRMPAVAPLKSCDVPDDHVADTDDVVTCQAPEQTRSPVVLTPLVALAAPVVVHPDPDSDGGWAAKSEPHTVNATICDAGDPRVIAPSDVPALTSLVV